MSLPDRTAHAAPPARRALRLFRALAVLALLACAALAFAPRAHAGELLVLSYHDIRDDVATTGDPDGFAVSTQHFAAHLDWLRGHGYQAVSLQQVVDAAEGRAPLPAKAVLLTFDDGLASVYTHAYPLLRAHGWPALVAVVTDWIELEEGRGIDYGPRAFTGADFLTWAQLREMQASGLVEVASHTDDLHHGVLGNPQGNQMPAAVTRVYDPATGTYESDAAWRARIRADLAASVAAIERELGRAPRAIVWPYAAYSAEGNAIAEALGMPISFDLEGARPQAVDGRDDLHGLERLLLAGNPGIRDLAGALHRDFEDEVVRAIQVDLDYVYDPDPAQVDANLGRLIERIRAIGPSHVFLQAFADPDGDGAADAVYFPNRHLPMRADLYSRVSWQLRTRAGVEVVAWMPVLGWVWPAGAAEAPRALAASNPDEIPRLDPFDPATERLVGDVYEDLAINAAMAGVLFHDDAFLREDEYPGRGTPAERTERLIALTAAFEARAERWRPKLTSVRNLYANVALDPRSEAWFAQRLDAFQRAYDVTAIMAMPWMEGAGDAPLPWLDRVVDAARATDPGLRRTMFELQVVDWRTRTPLDPAMLRAKAEHLRARGVRHLAYYPDDMIRGLPDAATARALVGARTFPVPPR